ncbi:hypothetical protein CQP30_21090, partial [Yersinia pestis]|nr:hypothetical protein [Yersinia pestis]MRO17254.1 hypothetical protein [Yersinia pestis]MRO21392.1 hypothetical protein [Yersinia pestis]MRO25557.1 hypothetical protein [Yersinia pestis]MRO37984.1 hypothetical protein [Yersinia pestis]
DKAKLPTEFPALAAKTEDPIKRWLFS